jgi:hypothetical protein
MSNKIEDAKSLMDCINLYGVRVCVNDVVQIFPRSRALVSFIGRVVNITPVAIVLENEENTLSIRLSEIKMVRIPKYVTK